MKQYPKLIYIMIGNQPKTLFKIYSNQSINHGMTIKYLKKNF